MLYLNIKNLIKSNDIQHVNKVVGCCRRNFLKFEEDDHFYIYNPNKTISNSFKKKVFTYLYTDMNKKLDKAFYLFLDDLSINTFDCDGYDSLDYRRKDWINGMIINKLHSELDRLLYV